MTRWGGADVGMILQKNAVAVLHVYWRFLVHRENGGTLGMDP